MYTGQLVSFVYAPLIASYLYAPAAIYQPFSFIHAIALVFYTLLLYLNIVESQFKRHPQHVSSAKYINAVGICGTLFSFFVPETYALLLIKYISWLFTFPYLLKLEQRSLRLTNDNHTQRASYIAMLSLALNVAHHVHPCPMLHALLWIASAMFFVYYNTAPQHHTYTYVNIIWILYGVHFALFQSHVISMTSLYHSYVILDVMSKSIFTFYYHQAIVKRIACNFGVLKVVRMLTPVINRAFAHNVIKQSDYNSLMDHIDVSNDNPEQLKADLIDELFPNETWKTMLSLKQNVIYHESICIMFCDMVEYSNYVHTHTLPETIAFVNDFYTNMDMLIHSRPNVKKIETIGDAYLVASLDPLDICQCAVDMIRQFGTKIRIGIHVGEAAECTLGLSKLRHAFVGDTVNIAARLENKSVAGRIHVSEAFRDVVTLYGNCDRQVEFEALPSPLDLKGVGIIKTYFVKN